jgi:hypothetical protein
MAKMQMRTTSGMESKDLSTSIQYAEVLNRSYAAANAEHKRNNSSNKLPTYLETQHEKYNKYDNVSDDKIEVLNLNVRSLPEGDEQELLKKLFKNQHVIKIKRDTDNISGLSKGAGKIQLRCLDKLQSQEVVKSLTDQGVSVEVESRENLKDISMVKSHGLRMKQHEEISKNKWLTNIRKEENKSRAVTPNLQSSRSVSPNFNLNMNTSISQISESLFQSQYERYERNHPKSRQCDLTHHSATTHNTSQFNKSQANYLSTASLNQSVNHIPASKEQSNISQMIYNTSVDEYTAINHST